MDADLAFALSLQFQDEELMITSGVQNTKAGHAKNLGRSSGRPGPLHPGRPLSIVDESWELIDPIPNIHDLFLQFNDAYFGGRLAGVEVKWSPRMTLCAGLCSYESRGGLCSIRLSQPLLKLRPRKDLVQTLLHEMIHALLFVTRNNKDHDSHGPEFHKHMYRINKESGANITVYHNFHDEVNNYRQHWWKCDGPCQWRRPFYGIVRRSMNRAPSKNDTWWAEHLVTCGGKFHKIKEPEDYGKKRKRDEERDKKSNGHADNLSEASASGSQDLSKWFKPTQNSEKTPAKRINEFSGNNSGSPIPRAVFQGMGHSLLPSNTESSVISKDEWIKRLMRKQELIPSGKTNRTKNDSITENQLRSRRDATSTIRSWKYRADKQCSNVQKMRNDDGNYSRESRTSIDECSGLSNCVASVHSSDPPFEVVSSLRSSNEPLPILTPPRLSGPSTFSSPVSNDRRIDKVDRNGKNNALAIVIDDSPATQRVVELVDCPVCPKKIPISSINRHLDQCLSRDTLLLQS